MTLRTPFYGRQLAAVVLLTGLTASALAEMEAQGPPSTQPATDSRIAPAHGQSVEPVAEQADDELPGRVRISPAGMVEEMHVAEQPLSTVLQMLSLEGRRNIIATPAVQGTVTADLYQVTFDEALEAILVANQCGYQVRGNFIYVYTNEELAQLAAAEAPAITRVFRLYYITAVDALAAVEPMLSEIGSITASKAAERGISPDAADAGGDSLAVHDYLVAHDYPARLAEIEAVLNKIDVRPQQVLIEATILRATLNDDNALGVDFTLLGGVDLEVLGSTSNGIIDLTTGQLPTDRLEKFNAAAQTDFRGTVPPGGLTFGLIKDHVAVFLRALEQVTDSVVLANPKILALNKHKGQVIVGRRDGYLTTTVTETQAIQTVEFLETGTQLIFRPFIGRDGDIRMELHPEDSIGGLTAANLPFETTTELTTNVQCRDGETILIGGLFREATSDTRSQIPLLGDIPGIGNAFRSKRDTSQFEEVIILLTVHIVKDEDAYAEAGRRQLEDVERIRVGLRRGLLWHGRERLAQAHYQRALEHFADGDTQRALWDVRMALHNHPRLLSAIKLKEQIREQRAWDDEGSVTRDFVARLISAESSPANADKPRFGRPAPPFIRPEGLHGPSGFDGDENQEEAS
jgi:type IV pilus assembly protein PilQ